MADVFQRRSGRGWRLRQQSLQLLHQWQEILHSEGRAAPVQRGLLLLASSAEELERLTRLKHGRQPPGAQLELMAAESLQQMVALQQLPPLPGEPLGGLWSARDGQLDPIVWMQALQDSALANGLQRSRAVVQTLNPQGPRWVLELSTAEQLNCDWVVLCAGLESQTLLHGLGLQWPMEPVSGQALELQRRPERSGWQHPMVWRGMNLVPRPGGRLWLGATVESGTVTTGDELEQLRQLQGDAPGWLLDAEVIQRWQGQRARPVGRPAPLLEQPLPRLLLVSGHYRNGIVLGPASAAWAADQITMVNSAVVGS